MVKKILIIGAHGFIGSSLAKYLLDFPKEYELTLWDTGCYTGKPSEEVIKARKEGLPKLNIHFEEKEYDTVIHLGSIAGCRSDIDSGLMFANNNGLLQLMLDGLKYKKFIYISSYCVKGAVDTAYSTSKKIAEAQCNAYVDKHELLIIRLPMVYGDNGRPDMLLTKIFNKEEIVFNGDPSTIYRYAVCIDDVCESIEVLIAAEVKGMINFISKNSYSMKEILDITGTEYTVTHADTRDYIACYTLKEEANMVLNTTLEDYIERGRRQNGKESKV